MIGDGENVLETISGIQNIGMVQNFLARIYSSNNDFTDIDFHKFMSI